MKKLFYLTLCIMVLYSCGEKRPAQIERPAFDISNTTMIEIAKIEMSDTATVIHIDAFMMPNGWIRVDPKTYIRESGSDEKLMITHSEGITIDEQLTIPEPEIKPEPGTRPEPVVTSFKLFFPPLRPEVTKIDYIEDMPEGGWQILGINLLPHAKIQFEPIPQDANKSSTEPLPTPEYSTKPAIVSGRMLGYVENFGRSTITLRTSDIVTGDDIEVELPIASDGSFSGEITPGKGGFVSTTEGYLFLIPGHETKLYVDLKKRGRLQARYRTDKEPGDSIYTYVSGGYFTYSEQNAINRATYNLFSYAKLAEETVAMNPEAFKRHLLGIMDAKIDALKQTAYPENVRMLMENNVRLAVYSLLMDYEDFINWAYSQVNEIKREDMAKVMYKAEKPDVAYYSFLNGALNDYMSYLPSYASFIQSLVEIDVLNDPNANEKSAKERFAFFKEKAAPILGTDKGILFDVIQAQIYGQQLSEMKLFSDADKQELQNVFSAKPVYAEALIAKNDKLVSMLASLKDNKECVLHEPPNVSQEKMFDAILAPYKGKVVFVDFWATWCGPCMAAMKSILPIKDEMKDKDVVFLYLTGETSPFGAFMQTYPTIKGEHYRVSSAQWKYWGNTYGIQGIPFYMVCDRQGKIISNYTGFPGVDTVKKDITSVL